MNVYISHAMSAGLAILVIIALVLSLNSVNEKWSAFLAEYEPAHICSAFQNSIGELQSNSGKIFMSIPKRIGGSDYSVLFSNRTIFLASSYGYYNCSIAENILLGGRANSRNVYIEKNQNTIEIKDA